MKKTVVITLVLLIFFMVINAQALNLKGKFALTPIGGLNLPIGDFAKEGEDGGAAKTGYGFGGNFEYFITDNISIGGSFSYRRFGVKTEDIEEHIGEEVARWAQQTLPGATATADIDDSKIKITSFGVFGKYLFTPSPQVSPYLKFGLGMGKGKGSYHDISGDILWVTDRISYDASVDIDADSRVYVDIGGGILYQLSENITLTGEVLFTRVMLDGADQEVDFELEVTEPGWSGEVKDKSKEEVNYNADYISAFVGLTFFFGGKK